MLSILERLPDPSTLDSEITIIVGKFTNLSNKVSVFFPKDLEDVLELGSNLPIPNSFALIEDTLNNFSKIVQKIPSDTDEIISVISEGLQFLKDDLGRLDEVFTPIVNMLNTVDPLLEKVELLNASINRINEIISTLPDKSLNLNLANIPEQFEYFSNIFDIFTEVAEISPFKELKAQIDTLKAWMTLSTNDLTELFRNQIQSLSDALPIQLNNIMQSGIDAIAVIETSLSALERSVWYDPYDKALDAVESINLDDLSQIKIYLDLLNNKIAEVTAIAATLNQKVQEIFDGLNGFDVNLFAQDLRYAFMDTINSISPEKPGMFAVIFHQIKSMISGLEISTINTLIKQVGQEVEKRTGEMTVSEITDVIDETTNSIVNAVDKVDLALVEVATTLSNLLTELQSLIPNINLPDLVSQIQNGLTLLNNKIKELLSKVNNILQEIINVVNEVGGDIGNFNIQSLTDAIGNLLSEVVQVLDDPQIQKILEDTQQSIDEITHNLEGATLKPVFDRVLDEIADLKKKLETVDVSELNDLLKAALKIALEIIKSIDFTTDVAGKLTDEFQIVLDQSKGLIQPLEEKYNEIVEQINQFDPGEIVGENLSPPFETLVEALNTIEPTKILEPLKVLYESLLDLLESLKPDNLLAPLIELHGQIVKVLQSLSPHDLITPLNDLLNEVTSLLDELGIEELITNITDSIDKANSFISDFLLGDQIMSTEFWGTLEQVQIQGSEFLEEAANQVDRYLDKMIESMASVEMPTLQPALNALGDAIIRIENHIKAPEIETRINNIADTLNTQDVGGGTTGLTKRWLEQKDRFENFTPPEKYADDYETLKDRVRDLSPVALLATPATLVEQIEARVQTIKSELTTAKKALVNLLTESQDKLDALLPDESTNESFKMLLREALEDQIGKPIKNIAHLLKNQLEKFSKALENITAIALKLKIPFEALKIIPDSIGRIRDVLLDAKNKIIAIDLNFLEDELQNSINDIIAQLNSNEVNPTSIISDLETSYQNSLQTLGSLYPNEDIQKLDTTYKEIVIKKIEKLHPDLTVTQPLKASYKNIIELEEELSIDEIFDQLTGKLTSIDKELEDGLDRTAKAFNGLLASLPL